MIIGIGTDICRIERMKKAISRDGFSERFFSGEENRLFAARKYAPFTIAGSFAAKEAVSKALGTGFYGFSLTDIEILRNENNAPYAVLHGGALTRFLSLSGTHIHVSISHDSEYATAFCVIEGDGKPSE